MRSRLVAEMIRASTLMGLRAPTGSTSPSWIGAQQLDLGGGRQLADLVEEQRAAGGLDELAGVTLGGAREGALFVSEQNRFHEIVRDARRN